jgi:hypothetical protein
VPGAIRIPGILAAAFAAGLSVSAAVGLVWSDAVPLGTFLEVFRVLRGPLAVVGLLFDVIALLCAVLAGLNLRDKPLAQRYSGMATVALALALITGLVGAEPLGRYISSWSLSALPDNAGTALSAWFWLHGARALFEGLAAASLLASVLAERPRRRLYAAVEHIEVDTGRPILVPHM